jgi:hypothetical protein
MKILFGNQEYLDIKLSPKNDAVVITTKTKWDEGSFAMSSVSIDEDQIDKIIAELIQIKTKIKNVTT